MKEYEILERNLKDSAAHSKLKLLKNGEIFGEEKPGGEKRIHIGSMSDEGKWDQFFFPNGGVTFEVIVSKIDLVRYLIDAKNEFFEPRQSYRLNISDFYDDLFKQTLKIKQDTFKICFEKNTDEKRYYLTRPEKNVLSKNYDYIIKICLPIVTQYVFLRIKGEDDKSYVFYLIPEFSPNINNSECKNNLQQIFYGAPGTGKSFAIKELTKGKDVIRTTFHPDSDYSTFVGCYKPSMTKNSQTILDYQSMVDKFKQYLEDTPVNITRACTLFGHDFHDSIVNMQENGAHTIPNLVADAYQSNTTYDTQVRAGMSVYESSHKEGDDLSKIVYRFIPQAFTNAYVRAWSTKDPVFLVIEEINRGNCAQIFGDLFQLLDRKNDESEYPVKADADLAQHLAEKLANSQRNDIPADVKSGDMLKLPSNLFIWATMNTSDQSLFPIDSAFKRRWDWKYIKIAQAYERDENGEYILDAEGKKIPLGWKLLNKDGQDWWEFLKKINAIIYSMTQSADKQLGYFFCKADDKVISVETFVNKVAFYLWNDVFKDYAEEGSTLFKFKKNEEDNEDSDLTFPDFFDEDGEVKADVAQRFINNVMNWKTEEKKDKTED